MENKDMDQIPEKEERYVRDADWLRTRYRPRNRIGQGLISAAPWVDVVLLLIFFTLLDSKMVLQPGFVIELPEASFRDGSRSSMLAVVISVETIDGSERQEIVFFDDVRFMVKSYEQMEKLKYAFAEYLKKMPEFNLIIQADKHVSHGTLVKLYDIAGDVGIKTVNIALRDVVEQEGKAVE